jgi:transcriptional regulator NrdR family protein
MNDIPTQFRKKALTLNSSMECPVCKSTKSEILDKRNFQHYAARRRRCSNGHRYSTVEMCKDFSKTPDETTQKAPADVEAILRQSLPLSIDKNKLKNIIFPISADVVINSLDNIINYKELVKNLHNL